VRARINVLSEIPAEWDRAIRQWRSLNAKHKMELAGVGVPSASEEYFFYQELMGMWPMEDPRSEEYDQLRERIQAHMMKALREAKLSTGWMNPDAAYEKGVADFVRAVLEPADDNHFPSEFRQFVRTVLRPGMWNGLAQTLLKIGAPGVPDFYQGSELWNLNLVDPDKRQPVDYARRRCLLEQIERMEQQGAEEVLEQLMRHPETGGIKLYVTSRALRFRKTHPQLFANGAYLPLRGVGDRQRHLVAFARATGNRSMIVVTGRHFVGMGGRDRAPVGDLWGDSVLLLRKELSDTVYRDVFTHRVLEVEGRKGRRFVPLARIFSHLPVALLEGEHLE
jgi:(1->4)-alpha-D-glucan 1-alpha-D-glucosylmutase